MKSKTKESIALIAKELKDIGSSLSGIRVALGEFHHDVEGKVESRDEEVRRLTERVETLERRFPKHQKA